MINETYIRRVNEIALNVIASKIDSIRKKSMTKTGCRVYEDGHIGISGTLGEATEDTWKDAIENLQDKVTYKAEPEKNTKKVRDLRESKISAEEFLNEAEALLENMRAEFPEFIFSNKIKATETETILKNDLELELINFDRYFSVELVVKEKQSVNIMDTLVLGLSRTFDKEAILNEAKELLKAYNNKVELPKERKLPVIVSLGELTGKIYDALNGNSLYKGVSIFSGKVGEKLFSEEFTVEVNRGADSYDTPFFDGEGSTLENESFPLIDNGVLNFGYTDKKTAEEYNIPNTAAGNAAYDGVPSVDLALTERIIRIKDNGKTLEQILGNQEAILVVLMSGGDCTNEGDFAAPVQTAYLTRDGKVVGRLPEFNAYGNIYEMFGKDYLGQSSDKPFFGENATVVKMNIQ